MKSPGRISTETLLTGLLLIVIFVLGSCRSKTQERAMASVPAMDLHTAAVLGDLDVIRQHVAAGSDLDIKEETVGSSPLITASVFGKTEAAKILIEGGADVNFQNNEGSSALHTAAFLCRVDIVEILLEAGADRKLKNNFGSTAYASVAGPFEDVVPIYNIFSKDLGPLGIKFDYEYLEETRPVIAQMLKP